MLSRIALVLSALFWVTMNYLLWRSEFGGHDHLGSIVPTELVWRKILTAPDNSMLDIFHHGKKAGDCRWAASAGQNPPVEQNIDEGPSPESVEKTAGGYRLTLDGGVETNAGPGRIHFDLELKLDARRQWQEFLLRVNFHENLVVVHSVAAEQTIHLHTESGGEKQEQEFTFAELNHPEKLLRSLDLPLPLGAMGAADSPSTTNREALPSLGLEWEARNDWMTIGHASVRVYRLEAHLIGDRKITILTSPVGEILRMELPDDWVLANDQAGVYQQGK